MANGVSDNISMSDTRSVTAAFEDKKLGKRSSKKDPEV